MDLTHPLRVVTPTLDGDVLRILAGVGPEIEFPVSTIHALLEEYSLSGLRKAADRLVDQGLVECRRVANAYVYRLNRDHLAFDAVIALAAQRATFFARLEAAFADWEIPPVYAALFGSASRWDMTPASDIDLFLVRPDGLAPAIDDPLTPWEIQTDTLAGAVGRWTGNPCNVMEYDVAEVAVELAAEVAAGGGVLLTTDAEGLHLAGDPDYLRDQVRDLSRRP